MKNVYYLLLLVLPALVCCRAEAQSERRLLWAEEFNYSGAPDPSKWTYEEGFIRNNEAQFYTRRAENATVADGMLVITARKEAYGDAAYTSASLHTRGLYEFQGGRIEVRAKLPSGRGVWPAVWTLGTNIGKVGWPLCGEIDIMEFVGYEPGKVYANVHTGNYNHSKGTGRGGHLDVSKPSDDFHVYAVEWFDGRMDFYFDDRKYFSCVRKGEGVGEWPFDAPQYLIINLAIGGAWGGQKGIDEGIFPVEYRIDYVRFYQL
ncbi:MAG: glycoside hydrolase family 16 protein [Tannerellaceae bacterium]|jgi:beta-glucanase (GH16 family)|nr:glycoside hydrolase family 16 protein [Tannerellaceae bacterium]